MMLRAALCHLVLFFGALPLAAQDMSRIGPLYEALALDEVVAIMREEGLDYGHQLADDLFPGATGSGWTTTVSEIYREARLHDIVRRELAARLEDADIDAMMAFFDTETGRRIIGLEISARRALLDSDVEAANNAALADMIARDDPLLGLIREFTGINELVENNVVGAMNSNFAFYVGLSEGGAFGGDFAEDEMLADVWSQEAQIRMETEQWLYSYLAMAYGPLPAGDLRAYIAFSETPPGQALNQAIFGAFDVMFVEVSRALGHAAARVMSSQDL